MIFEDDLKKSFIGKTLESVILSNDKEKIVFRFKDGTPPIAYGVEGDCCSSSWIEHLETPGDVDGAKVVDVKESGGVPWDGHACVEDVRDDDYNVTKKGCGHDSLSVYNITFRTDHGDIVLEFRNDSNGYYGGYLVEATP